MADKKNEKGQMDPMTKLSEEDRERAIRLLERDAKQKAKAKERRQTQQADPEAKAKQREATRRRTVQQRFLVAKAKDAGLVVTKEEVDAEIKKIEARKAK